MPDKHAKASNFLEAINKYAEEQRTQIQREVDDFKKEELEKAESEVLNDAFQLIQAEMAEMKTLISSDLSKKEMEGRKVLLEKRNQIEDEVFKKAEDKLIQFVKSKKYPTLLKRYAKEIAEVLNEPGTIVYVKKEDLSFSDIIKAEFPMGCTIEISDNIIIGGIYASNEDMGMVADESLDSKLEEQRTWFAENSGLKVV